jgi:hypothetical protein
MRCRWFHVLPLLVAAFWLPFQAVAAMAMPFCRHGEAHRMAPADQVDAQHCHMQEQPAGSDEHAPSCDNCEFCHLAAAGFMPTPEYVAAVISLGRDFRSHVVLAPASALPEPPQQPPKRPA